MGRMEQKIQQTIFFNTTPAELREIADFLENNPAKKILSETTYFLNENEGDFSNEICLRFIKEE